MMACLDCMWQGPKGCGTLIGVMRSRQCLRHIFNHPPPHGHAKDVSSAVIKIVCQSFRLQSDSTAAVSEHGLSRLCEG